MVGSLLWGHSCLGSRRDPNTGTLGPQNICGKEHCRNWYLPGGAPHSTCHPPMSSEGHGTPMAEPPAALNHPFFFFLLRRCRVKRKITAMATGSRIFSAFSAFFTFVPVPSSKARYLTMLLPDSMGRALPVRAEPCLCRQSHNQPTVHVGVCRLLPPWKETLSSASGCSDPVTGQHVPRERGCVGFSGEVGIQPEWGILSLSSSAHSELPYTKVSLQNPPFSTSTYISAVGQQGLWLCG